MPRPARHHQLTISHADASPFSEEGLRSFFEYRQLGIDKATTGEFGAQVIRAVPGQHSPGQWHAHTLDFQMVYVTRGWVEFEYENEGKKMLRAGSSVLQPPGIVHRELRHSDDMELIEITSPAGFETTPIDLANSGEGV
jgi:quercetin dioxygenase-like cupin family protein